MFAVSFLSDFVRQHSSLLAWLCLERYWAVTHARGGAQGRDDGRDDARNDLKSELPSFLTFHTSRI